MNATDFQQTQQTNRWLKYNGVNVAHIYAGTTELFQAQKLATQTLKEHGRLLQQNQAATLNNFLQATRNYKKRNKIYIHHLFLDICRFCVFCKQVSLNQFSQSLHISVMFENGENLIENQVCLLVREK
jgi:hypothetical protein